MNHPLSGSVDSLASPPLFAVSSVFSAIILAFGAQIGPMLARYATLPKSYSAIMPGGVYMCENIVIGMLRDSIEGLTSLSAALRKWQIRA
jgi:hypothetical protein